MVGVGSKRIGRRKAAQCGLAVGAALLEGCALEPREEFIGPGGFGGMAGQAGLAGGGVGTGTGGGGGASGQAGSLIVPPTPPPSSGLSPIPIGTPPSPLLACDGADSPLFCSEVVWNQTPARRVLYSWTTAEQLEELRADRVLLTRTEREGMGPGYAFTAMEALASRGMATENQLLRSVSARFARARYAWPSPWATRMGFPGEDYGDRLIQITLAPETWLLVVRDGTGIAVIDLDNRVVPFETAFAEVERIGAAYFVRTESAINGTFSECSGGYREFIVGDEALVESWSVETEEIRARIEADALLFERFLPVMRASTAVVTPDTFGQESACAWDYAASGELATYQRALALGSALYAPRPAELIAIAETLRASLFEPNPLIVRPGG
jgi:hypothetical protein